MITNVVHPEEADYQTFILHLSSFIYFRSLGV